jgi:15-cis-phytoene synthase
VDSFEGYDKKYLLAKFRHDTYDAIERRISSNPVLNAFQNSVHQFNIDIELIETFLQSMEMDLEKQLYTHEKYEQYILGSAEVVGLMCLHVFTEGDYVKYQELKPYAMKLGAAFQKVNFLRDMRDDYHILGRIYFPNVDIRYFTAETKQQIELEIENDFSIALQGIRKLPRQSRGGVYLAYVYYRSLFNKIKKLRPPEVLTGRIRINNGKKIRLMVNSLVEHKMNLI